MNKPPAWFALMAQPRHEEEVAAHLRGKGLESFVPIYRSRAMFPGYVFCRFAYTSRSPVLRTPGVKAVVGRSSKPTPLADEEILRIRTIQASGLRTHPWPYLSAGQKARIERGTLAGLEGVLIREKESLRVVVSLELLQRAVAVEIDRDMIRAVRGAEFDSMAHVYLTGNDSNADRA